MFNSRPAAHVFSRALLYALLYLFAAGAVYAQCPVPDPTDADVSVHPELSGKPAKALSEEPLLPEAGFLSNTRYTSQFFGFGLDLPLTVEDHEIMMPVMPEREHALLSLQYENGQHRGYITITALDPKPGFDLKTPEQQEAQTRTVTQPGVANPDVLPQLPVPDYMLSKLPRFHYALRHEGKNYLAEYWAPIQNYKVKVVIGTNDKDFLGKARAAMQDVKFYCTQDDGTLTDIEGNEIKPKGEPYHGPTVPTFRVNRALRDQPGKTIAAGEVNNGVYRNQSIGLRYDLPAQWRVLPPKPDNPPVDPIAQREFSFLQACTQTLLRVGQATQPGQSQEGAAIVLRALDPNCLSLHTPTSLSDKHTLDEVGASLEQLGTFGEVATDQLVALSGHLFMVFSGTYDDAAHDEDLPVRMSQSIFATRYTSYCLCGVYGRPTPRRWRRCPRAASRLAIRRR